MINDKTRARKTYSYFRARPVLSTEVTTNDMPDLTLTSTKVSGYTSDIGDLIAYDPTSTGGFTLRLPTAVGNKDKRVGFKNVSDDTTAVTLAGQFGQTIDGQISISLTQARLCGIVRSDDTNWIIEDIWYVITVPETPEYFSSVVAGAIYTTGSAAFSFGEGFTDPQQVGTDVKFYVGGGTGQNALFNKDVITSSSIVIKGGGLSTTNTSFNLVTDANVTNIQLGSTMGASSRTISVGGHVNVASNLTASIGRFTNGLSGSLTNLPDGTSYLIAGSNVTITSGTNGSVTVAATTSGGVLPLVLTVPAAITAPTTDTTGYSRAGVVNFDPSSLMSAGGGISREIRFSAFLDVQSGGGPGLEANLKLYDLDTASDILFLSSSTTPVGPASSSRKLSAVLSPGVDIANTLHTYEVLISRVNGSAGNQVNCYMAQFEVTYT